MAGDRCYVLSSFVHPLLRPFRVPELIAVLSSRVAGNIRTRAVLDVETKRGYWLTVHAQDHGVVPLSSSLQVSFDNRTLGVSY
jgi:hypothetical protein